MLAAALMFGGITAYTQQEPEAIAASDNEHVFQDKAVIEYRLDDVVK